MSNFFPMRKLDLGLMSKNWGWIFAFGLIMLILGVLAISYSFFTTIVSIIFLGTLLFLSGIVVIIDSFRSWWQKWPDFFIHLFMGILYLIAGGMLIKAPLLGSISITLFLAIFYIILGISRIVYVFTTHLPRRGWRIFNAIITLLLGVLILAEWPASGLFIIGLFIGIDLVISGWLYLMAGLAAKP